MKKLTKIALGVAACTLGLSAIAAETTVAVHGMIKSGTNWAADDGMRRGGHNKIGINEDGYVHAFGNEATHEISRFTAKTQVRMYRASSAL